MHIHENNIRNSILKEIAPPKYVNYSKCLQTHIYWIGKIHMEMNASFL